MSEELGLTAVVAALPEEVRPLLERLEEGPVSDRIGQSLSRPEPDPSDRFRRTMDRARFRAWGAGRIGSAPVVIAATGDGPQLAERGVGALLEGTRPDRLVVAGVAGGLESSLEVGDVVRATEVWSGTVRVAAVGAGGAGEKSGAGWSDGSGAGLRGEGEVRSGAVVTTDRIVSTPEARRELWRKVLDAGCRAETGVADLETAVYVRAARQRGIPWSVYRAVSDMVDESLPSYLESCRDRRGSVRSEAVVLRALSRPTTIPSLVRLRARVRRCADRLAERIRRDARTAWSRPARDRFRMEA